MTQAIYKITINPDESESKELYYTLANQDLKLANDLCKIMNKKQTDTMFFVRERIEGNDR